MSKTKGASVFLKEQRLALIESLLIRGIPNRKIIELLITKEQLGERQCSRLIQEAKVRVRTLGQGADFMDRLSLIDRRYEYLFQQEIQDNNRSGATKILLQHSKLILAAHKHGGLPNASTSKQSVTADLEGAIKALEKEREAEK